MFGSIGGPELILIFLVALLIFGPRKLPELGRMLGKGLGEFRRAANDLRVSLETEVARDGAQRSAERRPGTPAALPAGDQPGAPASGPEAVPAPGALERSGAAATPGADDLAAAYADAIAPGAPPSGGMVQAPAPIPAQAPAGAEPTAPAAVPDASDLHRAR